MLRRGNLRLLEAVVVVIEAGCARCSRVGDVDAVQRIRVLMPGAAEGREHGLETGLAAADVLAIENNLRSQVLQNGPDVARSRNGLQRLGVNARRNVRVGDV